MGYYQKFDELLPLIPLGLERDHRLLKRVDVIRVLERGFCDHPAQKERLHQPEEPLCLVRVIVKHWRELDGRVRGELPFELVVCTC